MLGKIKKLQLRDIWKHEALDFTKWLAKEENIIELSEEIGIDIEVLEIEANVGDFNVDILAKERDSERTIIIENQLEKTDHDHLGKLITYASGHEAEIIIWIVKQAREEHKKAIEWLNENIAENINFFLIEMELWQIGDSLPAPKFQIVVRPNDWAKNIKNASIKGELTNTKTKQLEFWQFFNDYSEKNKAKFSTRKASPHHWHDISYGKSGSHIALTIDSKNKCMACMLYISNDKELYTKFENNKDKIEKELGYSLDWKFLENKNASKIVKTFADFNLHEYEKWSIYCKELVTTVEKFKVVFNKYV